MPAPTSASHGWWMRQPRSDQKRWSAKTISWSVTAATSRAISRMTRGERRSRSRWARDEVAVEGLEGRARPGPASRQRVGRRGGRSRRAAARAADGQVGTRGRPAVAADEAVRRAVVARAARRRERPAAGGAAVERRVEAVEPQQPGLEVAAQELRARALLGRLHDGEGQPVDLLLGLALGRERVEELRAAREEERRVEAARARAEGRVQQLRLAEPQELGSLPAVERDPHLGERLEGRLVARPAARAPRGPRRAPCRAPA